MKKQHWKKIMSNQRTNVNVINVDINGNTCAICNGSTERNNILCEDHIDQANEHDLVYILEAEVPENTTELKPEYFTGKNLILDRFVFSTIIKENVRNIGLLYCFSKENFKDLHQIVIEAAKTYRKGLN